MRALAFWSFVALVAGNLVGEAGSQWHCDGGVCSGHGSGLVWDTLLHKTRLEIRSEHQSLEDNMCGHAIYTNDRVLFGFHVQQDGAVISGGVPVAAKTVAFNHNALAWRTLRTVVNGNEAEISVWVGDRVLNSATIKFSSERVGPVRVGVLCAPERSRTRVKNFHVREHFNPPSRRLHWPWAGLVPCNSWAGWKYNETHGRCYLTVSSARSWSDALSYCLARSSGNGEGGSNLLSIFTAEENSYVQSLGLDSEVWIGGNATANSSEWAWSDGSRMIYSNWETAKPTAEMGKNCATLRNSTAKWESANCSTKRTFFCARCGYDGTKHCMCPPGQYGYLTGWGWHGNVYYSGHCGVCGAGSYQPRFGARNCLSCPVGTFANETGSASCKQCPLGKTSSRDRRSCVPKPPTRHPSARPTSRPSPTPTVIPTTIPRFYVVNNTFRCWNDSGVGGHNNEVTTTTSLAACLAFCASRTVCGSVEWQTSSGACKVAHRRKETTGWARPGQDLGWTLCEFYNGTLHPTNTPTSPSPSSLPSLSPTAELTSTSNPSRPPSAQPSQLPTKIPTSQPSLVPASFYVVNNTFRCWNDSGVGGHNNEVTTTTSLAACLAFCASRSVCGSVEWQISTGACKVAHRRKETTGWARPGQDLGWILCEFYDGTLHPTNTPTLPSSRPSLSPPTAELTSNPSRPPSAQPSQRPTKILTSQPSLVPTTTTTPSVAPTPDPCPASIQVTTTTSALPFSLSGWKRSTFTGRATPRILTATNHYHILTDASNSFKSLVVAWNPTTSSIVKTVEISGIRYVDGATVNKATKTVTWRWAVYTSSGTNHYYKTSSFGSLAISCFLPPTALPTTTPTATDRPTAVPTRVPSVDPCPASIRVTTTNAALPFSVSGWRRSTFTGKPTPRVETPTVHYYVMTDASNNFKSLVVAWNPTTSSIVKQIQIDGIRYVDGATVNKASKIVTWRWAVYTSSGTNHYYRSSSFASLSISCFLLPTALPTIITAQPTSVPTRVPSVDACPALVRVVTTNAALPFSVSGWKRSTFTGRPTPRVETPSAHYYVMTDASNNFKSLVVAWNPTTSAIVKQVEIGGMRYVDGATVNKATKTVTWRWAVYTSSGTNHYYKSSSFASLSISCFLSPSSSPTMTPTKGPTAPTNFPTVSPSRSPTGIPTSLPTSTAPPTRLPTSSLTPTRAPTTDPCPVAVKVVTTQAALPFSVTGWRRSTSVGSATPCIQTATAHYYVLTESSNAFKSLIVAWNPTTASITKKVEVAGIRYVDGATVNKAAATVTWRWAVYTSSGTNHYYRKVSFASLGISCFDAPTKLPTQAPTTVPTATPTAPPPGTVTVLRVKFSVTFPSTGTVVITIELLRRVCAAEFGVPVWQVTRVSWSRRSARRRLLQGSSSLYDVEATVANTSAAVQNQVAQSLNSTMGAALSNATGQTATVGSIDVAEVAFSNAPIDGPSSDDDLVAGMKHTTVYASGGACLALLCCGLILTLIWKRRRAQKDVDCTGIEFALPDVGGPTAPTTDETEGELEVVMSI